MEKLQLVAMSPDANKVSDFIFLNKILYLLR